MTFLSLDISSILTITASDKAFQIAPGNSPTTDIHAISDLAIQHTNSPQTLQTPSLTIVRTPHQVLALALQPSWRNGWCRYQYSRSAYTQLYRIHCRNSRERDTNPKNRLIFIVTHILKALAKPLKVFQSRYIRILSRRPLYHFIEKSVSGYFSTDALREPL